MTSRYALDALLDEFAATIARLHRVVDSSKNHNAFAKTRREVETSRERIHAHFAAPAQTAEGEWVLVPREATREMLNAAIDAHGHKLCEISALGFRRSPQWMFKESYAAMLGAAPAQQPAAPEPACCDWTEDAAHENGAYYNLCVRERIGGGRD